MKEKPMSLKYFHILFIIASIGLCFFFAWWAFGEYQEKQSPGYLITAAVSFLISVGLIVYAVKFAKKIKE